MAALIHPQPAGGLTVDGLSLLRASGRPRFGVGPVGRSVVVDAAVVPSGFGVRGSASRALPTGWNWMPQ